MKIQEVLNTGFKQKAFHLYGRSNRQEFWLFYITSLIFMLISCSFYLIPIIGSLIQAVALIYILICQITATVRRIHDLNRKAHIVALPYILTLIYFIALIPMYALQKDIAPYVMNGLLLIIVAIYGFILFLCSKKGTEGDNSFGTDPLNTNIQQKDFINPEHLEVPEYLGDPWRKFKNKTDRLKKEQEAKLAQEKTAEKEQAEPQQKQ